MNATLASISTPPGTDNAKHSNTNAALAHGGPANMPPAHIHHPSKPASLLQTPTENPLKIASDEPDSKDYSNHSSATTYERKKHPPNPNRKHYANSGGGGGGAGGPYRASMNPALNNHSNSNSSVTANNSSSNNSNNNNNNQTSTLGGGAPTVGIRKGPLIHQPASEANGMC